MALQRAEKAPPPPDEVGLVDRAQKGEPDAVREIMRRYNRRLYRVARAVSGDDTEAEDILQDAYLNAFRDLDRFQGRSTLVTWLTRIVLNEAFGRLRRARPTVELDGLTGDAQQREIHRQTRQ